MIMGSHDHKQLLLGSVLSRIDGFDDGDLCWQRIDSLTLHRDGQFDWHTQTTSAEAGQAPQFHSEHLTGIWQVIGTNIGPHFLQLGTDDGDMFSFAITRNEPGSYVLNKKLWSFQKTGVLQLAA